MTKLTKREIVMKVHDAIVLAFTASIHHWTLDSEGNVEAFDVKGRSLIKVRSKALRRALPRGERWEAQGEFEIKQIDRDQPPDVGFGGGGGGGDDDRPPPGISPKVKDRAA